ncbi:MAG: class III signal peptide-containing protein, partial [Candidatus Hydrothermarchaeales archaeon]
MERSFKNSKLRRGQVSIEFILIVAAILVIVITVLPFISRSAELNKGIAAARDGAQFGAAMRGMGYSSEGGNPTGVIKIDRVEYTIIDNPSGLDNVSISIYVRGPTELNTNSVRGTIRTEAQRYVAYAMTGEWPSGATVTRASRTGSYYIFAPISCNSSTWIET